MCRLLGFSSSSPVIIEPYLQHMRRFSHEGHAIKPPKPNINYLHDGAFPHPDGWGLVCLDRRGQLIAPIKNDRSASIDPELCEYQALSTSLWIGHVRRATPGIPITPEHAHPFEYEGIALAHNGSLAGSIYEKAKEYEESDSHLFLKLLAEYWRPRTLDTLADMLCALLEDESLVGKFDSANLLIAEGKTLYGLRWSNIREEYFTLYFRQKPDRVELASQPFISDPNGWQLLKHRELIALQAGDIVERVSL
jgi:predicted glutamine amidotransferase